MATHAGRQRTYFSKVLSIVTLYGKYTRAIIFEKICQGVAKIPRGGGTGRGALEVHQSAAAPCSWPPLS
jgi:hypothetical protein